MKKDECRTSNRNFIDAFKNALNGIIYTIKTQKNIKIQLVFAIIVIVAGIFFNLNFTEFLFIIFSCGLVFVTEIINTAIETTVNLYTTDYHPLAKIAKDVGAGAVLVASLNAIIVGCIVFLGKIF